MTPDQENPGPFRVVAVDGGAASGKSTTSKRIAEICHYLHVDTGSHYRAVAHACLGAGVLPADGVGLRRFLGNLSLQSRIEGRESLICFNGREPPDPPILRSADVNQSVSLYAALPVVREAVKAYQRDQVGLARDAGFAGIIMDGRDIGTVILPDADLKVFLVADPGKRQQRRELEGGADTIADRDHVDSTRETAPLRPAPDALVIDNSDLPIEAVVERILSRLGVAPGSDKP